MSNDTPQMESAVKNSDPRVQSGFQLASIALLITVAACVLACIDMRFWDEQNTAIRAQGPGVMPALFGGGALFGGIVGFVYAISRRSGRRLYAIAPFMGAFASIAGVLILFAPAAMWRSVIAVSVLLIAAIGFRLGAD